MTTRHTADGDKVRAEVVMRVTPSMRGRNNAAASKSTSAWCSRTTLR